MRPVTVVRTACPIFTTPPAPRAASEAPVGDAALVEVTWMARLVELEPLEGVTVTTATTPFDIAELLLAQIKQVMEVGVVLQLLDFPAFTPLCPTEIDRALKSVGEAVSVN